MLQVSGENYYCSASRDGNWFWRSCSALVAMGTVLEYTEEQFHSIFSICSNVLNSKGAHVSAGSWTSSVHTGNWCGKLFFGVHELRERSPKPWFTPNTCLLVEQQSGQLSLCHLQDVRSVLELGIPCPDQVFVQRSFFLSCFSGSQQGLFSFGCICIHCFSWPPLCQPGMTFGCLVSLFAPALLLSAGQGVEGEHCASCQVLSVLWGINALCRGHKPWGIYEGTTNCYNIFRHPQIKWLLKQGCGVDAATGILCCFKSTEEIKIPTAPFQCLAQAEVALGPLFNFWLSDCFCTWIFFFL